jgi:hypothetical protein
MKKSNFALRLQPSLLDEARRAADEEGVALNQLINVAVAEKLAAIRTEAFFRARASRVNTTEALEILQRLGKGNPPIEGDELPEEDSRVVIAKGGKARQSGASARNS